MKWKEAFTETFKIIGVFLLTLNLSCYMLAIFPLGWSNAPLWYWGLWVIWSVPTVFSLVVFKMYTEGKIK